MILDWIVDRGWATWLLIVGGAAIFVCAVVLIANATEKHYDRAGCHSFADRTGRETRFVEYTYWSWDCLTPSEDGKWISVDNLRDFT